jgi:hypothetical protein
MSVKSRRRYRREGHSADTVGGFIKVSYPFRGSASKFTKDKN